MGTRGLPETINPGDPGHRDHHDAVHTLLNPIFDNWKVTGAGQGLRIDRPDDLDEENLGFQWFSTDTGALDRWDGDGWAPLFRFSDELSPYDFGAVGNNAADDTDAVQAWLNALGNGVAGVAPAGTFKTRNVELTNKSDLLIHGTGGIFQFTGTDLGLGGVGFQLVGENTDLTIAGLKFKGDANAAHKHYGLWCHSGTVMQTVRVSKNRFEDLASGCTLGSDTSLDDVADIELSANYFDNIVGINPGEGYGAWGANCLGWRVISNWFSRVQRHSIYYGKGEGAVIANNVIVRHREGIALAGSPRSALVVARCKNVSVTGNLIHEPNDCAIEVTSDIVQNLDCGNVSVVGNVVTRSFPVQQPVIALGEGSASAKNTYNVNVSGNSIFTDHGGEGSGSPIQIYNGTSIDIVDNTMQMLNVAAAGQLGFVGLQGLGESGASVNKTNNIMVKNNRGYATGAGARGVYLYNAFAESECRADFVGNRWDVGTATKFGRSTTVTNPNIFVSDEPDGGLDVAVRRWPDGHVQTSVTLDFPSIAPNTSADVFVPGSMFDDIGTNPRIAVTPDLHIDAQLIVMPIPRSSGDGFYLRMANIGALAIDESALTFLFDVWPTP